MGGPGFFVLELGEANEFPSELLVLMLGGGMHWLLLDGQWFCAHPKLWGKQRPLFSHFGHWSKLEAFADIKGLENWDEVSPILVGAVLEDAVIEDKRSQFTLLQGGDKHYLEVPNDSGLLSIFAGTLEPRELHAEDSLWDAWVITQQQLQTPPRKTDK